MIQIKNASVLLVLLQTDIVSSQSYVTWSTSHLGISNRVGSFPEGMVNANTIDLGNHVESRTSNTVSTLSPDDNRINWNLSAIAPILGTKTHCASQCSSKSIIGTFSTTTDSIASYFVEQNSYIAGSRPIVVTITDSCVINKPTFN